MKKIISLVLSIVIVYSFTIFVSAQNGDVTGNIYSTDIMAYVNGVPIESYNIGGKTAIVIEDLYDTENWDYCYGFCWNYDDETRTLTVNSQYYDKYFTKKEIIKGTVGNISGNIYSTDIKVIFNSKEVPSYNIGGRTAVCIEDLGEISENGVNFEFNYSDYLCNFNWNEESRTVCLNSYQEKSYRSFTEYPIRKLAFKLDDNKLSCTFDQMNTYVPTLEVNFSNEFQNDIFKIKPIYMDNDIVGSLYIDDNKNPRLQLDYEGVYNKTKDLATVFSYDEANKFVTDNFQVIDKKEDENATVYIAQKENMKYFLYAFKNGGFLANGGYSSDHTLEFRDSENDGLCLYVYPFAGPHGATSMMQPFSTSYFDFFGRYDNFVGESFSGYAKQGLKFGNVVVTVDGVNYDVDAMSYYNITATMVNVDKMAEILGIVYKFVNGKFVFDTKSTKHSISIDADNMTGSYGNTDYPAYSMITKDVVLNGEKTEFTYLGGGTLLTNGKRHEKYVNPFFYNNQAYVPYYFFEKLYNLTEKGLTISWFKDSYNISDEIQGEYYTALMDREKRCVIIVDNFGHYAIAKDIPYYDNESTLKFTIDGGGLNINVSPFGTMRGENNINVYIKFDLYEFREIEK